MSVAKNQRDALSIRSSEQNKFSGGRPLQGLNATLKSSDMDLQFVTVRVQKVERVTLAMVLLPLLRSGVDQPGTKRLVVRCRYGKRDVVVCQIQGPFRQVRFEGQTYPEIACSEVRALVPASCRAKPQILAIKAECAIQIDDRQCDVIQARNHTQKANTGNLKRCHYE